jgi:predicted nucleotidyltransferase
MNTPILEVVQSSAQQLAHLCEQSQVARLELFGSANTDRFDPARSDLDFLVEFSDNSPKGASARFFALRQGLESLFGREVDLVDVQTIQNPYFLEAIAPTRRVVYGD